MNECKPLAVGHLIPVPVLQRLHLIAEERAQPRGRTVPVDPIKPTLKAPGTKRLKLKYDKPLSSFAFNFDLRRYILACTNKYQWTRLSSEGTLSDNSNYDLSSYTTFSSLSTGTVQTSGVYAKVGWCKLKR